MEQTKNASSERDIPITNEMFEKLNELKDKVDSDYIFPSIKGKQLSERTILTKCKNTAKAAGITKNATLHKWDIPLPASQKR